MYSFHSTYILFILILFYTQYKVAIHLRRTVSSQDNKIPSLVFRYPPNSIISSRILRVTRKNQRFIHRIDTSSPPPPPPPPRIPVTRIKKPLRSEDTFADTALNFLSLARILTTKQTKPGEAFPVSRDTPPLLYPSSSSFPLPLRWNLALETEVTTFLWDMPPGENLPGGEKEGGEREREEGCRFIRPRLDTTPPPIQIHRNCANRRA